MQNECQRDVQDRSTEDANKGPMYFARLFKYYKQDYIPLIKNKLPLERISAKTEYSLNRKYYDKLNLLSEKYGIDIDKYIRFCLKNRGNTEIKDMLDIINIQSFITFLKEEEYLNVVYNGYEDTAHRIADICIERDITPSEYISELVSNNTLAYEYYTGNISKYFIAGITNFKELYENLDYLNKEELSIVYEATDQLRNTLHESLMKYKNNFVGPISYTTSIIKSKIQTKKTNNTQKEN